MVTKSELSIQQLLLLNSEMKHAEKSLGLAFLMLLGGHLGLHRFYLKRFTSGTIQLVLFIVATISYFVFSFLTAIELADAMLLFFFITFVLLPGLVLFI